MISDGQAVAVAAKPAESVISEPLPARGLTASRALQRALIVLVVMGSLYLIAGFVLGRSSWRSLLGDQALMQRLPLIIGLILIGVALRAVRWLYYGRILGWKLPAGRSVAAFIASFSLTATPGKMGELLKSGLLKTHYQVPVSESAAVLIVERFGDIAAVLVLALIGVRFFGGSGYWVLACVAVAAIFVALVNRSVHGRLLALARRIPLAGRVVESVVEALRRASATLVLLLKPRPLALGLLLAFVAWSCEVVSMLVLFGSLNVHLPVAAVSSLYGTATLAGAASMLPGGVGGFEPLSVLMLAHLGTEADLATSAILFFRVCSLWLVSLLGLFVLLAWLAIPPKRVPGVEP